MAVASIDTAVSSNVRHLRPPIVTFKPSIWRGDIFSTFTYDDQVQERYTKEMEELKKEARSMLTVAMPTKLIAVVDKLERLGLAYHFETEIKEILKQVYDSADTGEDDLFTTALRFRLLRQHQYSVSCNVFDKFVDEERKWKSGEGLISSDVEGMLSLYEAAHVRIHDEKVLDEAVAFTVHHLTNMLPILEESSNLMKEKVQKALQHSIHRSCPFLNFRFYISLYENDGSTDGFLIKLAKLNFNFLQNIYRKELAGITRWWDKCDLMSKLPYVRDRLVECYLWGTSFRYEPQYSYLREMIAKTMQMITVLDDTYDNYATLEETDLFTEILYRWNLDEIDALPDYMKDIYRLIMSVCEDYEGDAKKQDKSFAAHYYVEAIKRVTRAYNKEQKWIMEQEMPCYDEYMRNAVITSCIYPMFISFVPGIKSITQEEVEWLLSEPQIVITTAIMGRNLDDLASDQRENREGELATALDHYMKDKGVSRQEANIEVGQLIEDGWKDINVEWCKGKGSSFVAKEMILQLLNYGRVAEVTYHNKHDGFSDPEKHVAPLVRALYLDPLLI